MSETAKDGASGDPSILPSSQPNYGSGNQGYVQKIIERAILRVTGKDIVVTGPFPIPAEANSVNVETHPEAFSKLGVGSGGERARSQKRAMHQNQVGPIPASPRHVLVRSDIEVFNGVLSVGGYFDDGNDRWCALGCAEISVPIDARREVVLGRQVEFGGGGAGGPTVGSQCGSGPSPPLINGSSNKQSKMDRLAAAWSAKHHVSVHMIQKAVEKLHGQRMNQGLDGFKGLRPADVEALVIKSIYGRNAGTGANRSSITGISAMGAPVPPPQKSAPHPCQNLSPSTGFTFKGCKTVREAESRFSAAYMKNASLSGPRRSRHALCAAVTSWMRKSGPS